MIFTLGPEGTHSSFATSKIFPQEKAIYEHNFYSLFEKLLSRGGSAVLPLENSIQGTVREVWDFLLESDFKIWHTMRMSISYILVAQGEKFSRIASHPQSLAQCKNFLMEHYPGIELVTTASTAAALSLAQEDTDCAAIISSEIQQMDHGLCVVYEDLETSQDNETLFGVISKEPLFVDERKGLMSIVITPTKDRAGLLFELLKPFKDHGINLTRLESRARGKKLGDYAFFIDLKSAPEDPSLLKAFEEVKNIAEVKIIGIY